MLMQAARDQIKRSIDLRNRLRSQLVPGFSSAGTAPVAETRMVEPAFPMLQPTSNPPSQPPLNQAAVSFAPLKTSEEENKKAAAAVAAKLAASTSSAQMLTSVLSSLVAEEAASMNNGLSSGGFSAIFPPEKRLKLEKPMAVSDVNNSDMGNSPYYSPLQQQPVTNMSVASSSNMQPMPQLNQLQAPFVPGQPPIPSHSPASPPASQYIQSSGMMAMPYGYGANTLPPPPPLPPHIAVGLARPASQSSTQPQTPQQQQPPPASGGFYRPPGIGFYGQSQPSTPPVPRQ